MTSNHQQQFQYEDSIERFGLRDHGQTIQRRLVVPTGKTFSTSVTPGYRFDKNDLAASYEQAWLRSTKWPRSRGDKSSPVTIVDLFSGCGGMTLGVVEACRAVGRKAQPILAADVDHDALQVFTANFQDTPTWDRPLEELLDGAIGKKPTDSERRLIRGLGPVEMLLGGPPCQGHSNLNNHTRRDDEKNSLMSRMVRFAELVEPTHILIENVPQARLDQKDIVGSTVKGLENLGYTVRCEDVDLSRLGVPQNRRRLVIVASYTSKPIQPFEEIDSRPSSPRDLSWAIKDLLKKQKSTIFETTSTPSPTNRQRIEYLFEHDLYDLPDTQRPDCHRLKPHNYKAVYGRLDWEKPAPTITTGYGCTGQGRFVHPQRRRTLTHHEAARLQFFPDFFDFSALQTRISLSRVIGNAVPSKLTYAFAVSLLTP